VKDIAVKGYCSKKLCKETSSGRGSRLKERLIVCSADVCGGEWNIPRMFAIFGTYWLKLLHVCLMHLHKRVDKCADRHFYITEAAATVEPSTERDLQTNGEC